MSVCQHFTEAEIPITKLQKNFKKLAIVCYHKRCLCKICIKMQLPVVGTPMVQIYSVLVLILESLLRNCRGVLQNPDKPHTKNCVVWDHEKSSLFFLVFLAFEFFPLQFRGLAHVSWNICLHKSLQRSLISIFFWGQTWQLSCTRPVYVDLSVCLLDL